LRLNVPNRMLGRIRINNLGFRGPDIERTKPDDTVRLAFLGSSSTYDPYSPEGQNWPHLVALKLGRRLEGCKVDFVNGGKPGYDAGSLAKLYQHFIAETDPDLVLIMTGDVSSGLDWMAEQQGINTDHTSYQSPFNQYSLLLQKLEKNFQIIKLQRNADSRADKLVVDFESASGMYKKNLVDLVETVNDHKRLIGIITLSSQLSEDMNIEELIAAGNTNLYYTPYVYLPDLPTLLKSFNKAIHEVAARQNVFVINGEREIPSDRTHYKDSGHFTPAGSEVMSTRVFSRLISNPQVVSLLEQKGCNVVPARN
jgi:hypothetical protein